VWILSSLGRPDRIQAVIESYDWGKEKVILALYDGDKKLAKYLQRNWPENWKVELVNVLCNGPTYQEILRRYPNEPNYGFLADDAILDEQGMLRLLEDAAGAWNVAYANDQHHGEAIPTMPCLGGNLVRAVGYLSPSCLLHMAIDCAWYEIGKRLGALRYMEELTYTHLNPVWGTGVDDRTYQLARQNSHDYELLFRGWMLGGELEAAVERVRAAKLRAKWAA
jgi:hypothetical protein